MFEKKKNGWKIVRRKASNSFKAFVSRKMLGRRRRNICKRRKKALQPNRNRRQYLPSSLRS